MQEFKDSELIKTDHINTRAEVVQYKIVQVIVLIILFIGVAFLLLKNYRSETEILSITKLWKWIVCIVLPLAVWCIHFAIIQLLGNYHNDIFVVFGMAKFIYLITCPLFFIVVFGIKLRKQIDLWWYTLLFALALSIYIEIKICLDLAS